MTFFMLMDVHKMQRITSGDETWISFVNGETEEKSKPWVHTHSPNKQRKLKQHCLPERRQLFSGIEEKY
jgi:hypothetical protein